MGDETGYARAVPGATGTSYSGGSGSGAANINCYEGPTWAQYAEGNGGTGGPGRAYRTKSGWASRSAAGGTGNPGGYGGEHTSGVTSNVGNSVVYKGNDGTGGLLIIYANKFNNNNEINANGVDSTTSHWLSGGASGGGSINIFYNELIKKGSIEANGGIGRNNGGSGGNGTVTIGCIETGSFVKNTD